VIAYRMSRFTHQLARLLVKTPFAGLPNLLANQLLVPELIQDQVKPELISQHILDYLDHPEKIESLKTSFIQLHKDLRSPSGRCISRAILDLMCN
jgi:lipid-A-disaccharide synthase